MNTRSSATASAAATGPVVGGYRKKLRIRTRLCQPAPERVTVSQNDRDNGPLRASSSRFDHRRLQPAVSQASCPVNRPDICRFASTDAASQIRSCVVLWEVPECGQRWSDAIEKFRKRSSKGVDPDNLSARQWHSDKDICRSDQGSPRASVFSGSRGPDYDLVLSDCSSVPPLAPWLPCFPGCSFALASRAECIFARGLP